MKRLLVVALALAALAPATSHAAFPLPRPGLCLMVPMKPGNCSYTALTNGTITYALQGAVEFRITRAGNTSRTCVFGSGGGTGPNIRKGDGVVIVGKTNTTSYLGALASATVKPWTGSAKLWPC